MHHSISGGFFKDTECMYSTDVNRYSVMRDLSSLTVKNKNSEYEFMIEYDDNEYFRWTQNTLPTSKVETLGCDVGVKFVANPYNITKFRGLLKSSNTESCFDGDISTGYYFSVGTIYFTNRIPGKIIDDKGNVKYLSVDSLSLWALARMKKISCQGRKNNLSSSLSLMIVLLFYSS